MKRVMSTLGVIGLSVLVSSIAYAALPDDIVLFMTFEEGSGTDVKDISKYGNHGVATVASWTDGKLGGGFEFDASKTVITVEPSDVLTALKEPMSIGYWINILSFPADWQAVAEMESMPGNRTNGWKTGLSNMNPVFTTYGVKDHIGTGTVQAEEWTHIAWVYDGKTATLYINGEVDSEIAGSGSIDVAQSPSLNIGAEAGSPGNYAIHAILDDLWVSNVAKTQEDIQELMEFVEPVKPQGKAATTWGALKL